jgi:hypothetical protein
MAKKIENLQSLDARVERTQIYQDSTSPYSVLAAPN